MLKRAYRNTISAFQSLPNDILRKKGMSVSNGYTELRQREDYNQLLDNTLQRYQEERLDESECNSSKLAQHQEHQLFLPLLPYDLLIQIFKELDLNDLVCCAVVSQTWCDFMADWPYFWQKLSREMPQLNKNSLEALLRRQAEKFRLDGPVYPDVLYNIIFLLSCTSHNQNIHTLREFFYSFFLKMKWMTCLYEFKVLNCETRFPIIDFDNIAFSSDNIDFLTFALSSTSSPIKQLTFVDCQIPQQKIATHLLKTCTNVEHVSFSHGSTPLGITKEIPRPKMQDISMSPHHKFGNLTYLKLSFTYYNNEYEVTDNDCIHNGQLGSLLSQCQNLRYLFMDSGGTIHHGHCLDQLLNHCQRLETLVISPNAEFPSECSNNCNINTTTQKAGLRQLVLSGDHLRIIDTDMISIYKQHYKTLEMIYLYFHSIDEITRSFIKLAQSKAPQLRQLYLSTDNSFIPISIHQIGYPSINKALVTLLSGGCPELNVLHIINNDFNFSMPESKYNGDNYFNISDKVLKAIATSCPELHILRFLGPRRYRKRGIIDFATNGVKKLVELEMDIHPDHLVEIVTHIKSLQLLTFSGPQTPLSEVTQNALTEIFEERARIAIQPSV